MRGMKMQGLVGFKNDTCFEEKHNCARGWAYTIKHMCLMLDVKGRDAAVKEQRRTWATRVIQYFDGELPRLRLLIFLDETDVPTLKRSSDYRGFFHPIDKYHFNITLWPRVLAEALRTINQPAFESTYHYDALVYLPDSTCQAEASLTMTLAHELQHFIQYGFNRTVWAWNSIPTNLEQTTRASLRLQWQDIPVECEARIVAKRASQAILGHERTDEYIAFKTNEHVTDSDAADWEFIRGIDTSQPYDCTVKTRDLFQRLVPFRNELGQILDTAKGLPEFASLNLDDILQA
jgi:hypothetical protein